MRISVRHMLPLFIAFSLAGCGGSNSSPLTPGSGSSQSANRITVPLTQDAQSVTLPTFDSLMGTMRLSSSNATLGTTMTIVARAGRPSDVLSAIRKRDDSATDLDVYDEYEIDFSNTTVYTTTPTFTFTLPASASTANKQFFVAVDQPSDANAIATLVTIGPATVSGQTLTFAPVNTPLTFVANQEYFVVIFGDGPVTPVAGAS